MPWYLSVTDVFEIGSVIDVIRDVGCVQPGNVAEVHVGDGAAGARASTGARTESNWPSERNVCTTPAVVVTVTIPFTKATTSSSPAGGLNPAAPLRAKPTVEPSARVSTISVASTRACEYSAPSESRLLNVHPRGSTRASGDNQVIGNVPYVPDPDARYNARWPAPDGFRYVTVIGNTCPVVAVNPVDGAETFAIPVYAPDDIAVG
ncbi:MAG: hypothetical protein ACK5CE_22875 [Actinomycetes bacterium]